MKTDIGFIKDLLLQMNKKTPSVVGDHSVNKNEKPWEEEEESGETKEVRMCLFVLGSRK